MANDTFDGIARKLLLRCPKLGPFIARDLIKSSFHDLVEIWQWSWLLKRSQLTVPAQYNTGTAAVVYGQPTATITTGVVDVSHIGRQFRTAIGSPILTITGVDVGANTYTLSENWFGVTNPSSLYSVYQAYLSMPSDFHAFFSVVDPTTYWTVRTEGVTLEMIDNRDPQRAVAGSPPRYLAPFDYYNGLARYELWPHQKAQSFYLMAYESRPVDPFDPGAIYPALLPSDLLLERGLMYAAKWPGPNRNDPNPYYSDNTAKFHEEQYNRRLGILIKQDVEHMQRSVYYQDDQNQNQRNINAAYMQKTDGTQW
jgi:hypothetical protein